MNISPLQKTGLALLMLLLVPVMLYSFYQVYSLNKNEQLLQEIYQNQLGSVIFSLNQYTDDVLANWANKTGWILEEEDHVARERMEALLYSNLSIRGISVFESIYGGRVQQYALDSAEDIYEVESLKKILIGNEQRLEKLKVYQQGGYRKIEVLHHHAATGQVVLAFVLGGRETGLQIGCMQVAVDDFVMQVLAPKIQEASQEQFVISVIAAGGAGSPVYTTDPEVPLSAAAQQKAGCWLFPDHSISIGMRGQTIQQVVDDRFATSLWVLLLLNVVLLSGTWLVFANIRKQIRLAQMKSDFVSNVSHEIRTPLAMISMFAETLQMGRVRSEDKKQQYYQIIAQEATRLAGTVNKILSFARNEARKRQFQFEEVDLVQVTAHVVNSYRFHLKSKGFTVDVSHQVAVAMLMADREALEECLINLLDNAIKYSESYKQIKVATGRQGQKVFVEVKDQGTGIDPVHQLAIFEKFFRVPQGEVHNTKGTGLGLTLVKQIVEAHGGEITLESAPGKGSAFRLWFPEKRQDPATVSASEQAG